MTPTPISRQLHVVYCLTSSGGDLYEAMTRVSLATLRLTNPSARITIACDEQTHQALQACCSQLFHEADDVRSFPTPDGPPTYRNRYVKTQLGRLIDGPFLFLDSDTVVRKPITELKDTKEDLAGVANNCTFNRSLQIWIEDQRTLDVMSWEPFDPYINGGFLWYSGSTSAKSFAERWHDSWDCSYRVTGSFRDQPSLNYALRASFCSVRSLDFIWNAQISQQPALACDANIWHYYTTEGIKRATDFFKELELQLGSSDRTPMISAKRLLCKSHPFVSNTLLTYALSAYTLRSNILSEAQIRLYSQGWVALPSVLRQKINRRFSLNM